MQDLERGSHFADVVHQRGQAELAQQRTVDAERPRLPHGEDRDVHHVREGVVVVVLQRRQREQRGAVLGDRLGEAVDHRARRGGIRFPFVLRRLPELTGHGDRVVVQLLDRRHVGQIAGDLLLDDDAADADALQVGQVEARPAGVSPFERGDRLDEAGELLRADAAIEGDAIDAALLQPPGQRPDCIGFGDRHVIDNHLVADQTDDDRGCEPVQQLDRSGERLEVAGDQGMAL